MQKVQRNVLYVPSSGIHPLERRSWRWSRNLYLARHFQRRYLTIDELNRHKEGTETLSYLLYKFLLQTPDRERVVVLGSGWAGYTVAHRLDPKKFQTVLVSPRSYFVFTPLLASTSVGTLEFRVALEPVHSRRSKISFFQGWADSVDFSNKKVTIEEAVGDPRQSSALIGDHHEGESLERRAQEKAMKFKKGELFDLNYDKLIIAVGCYSQTFGIPGVKEHALFLKDVGDARKIRNRLLVCFETAALPTTSDEMKKYLLNFAIVGGGPTGIEFSAELHDIIVQDLSRIYPELMKFVNITIYDVAPKVLSMFDEQLSKYAMQTLSREGVTIKTSHHVAELRQGVPAPHHKDQNIRDKLTCWTLRTEEEGDIGVGMVVWSTGLQMNPFVENALSKTFQLPVDGVDFSNYGPSDAASDGWIIKKQPKSGAIITNDKLQVILEPKSDPDKRRAVLKNVFALGDCALLEGTMFPATAQVAAQKADWLGKRLNKEDIESKEFKWRDLGIMAYIGNYNAIMQSGRGHNVSGRLAWLIWRGAYLTKTVSLRNKILIPIMWALNWMFGRDTSRKVFFASRARNQWTDVRFQAFEFAETTPYAENKFHFASNSVEHVLIIKRKHHCWLDMASIVQAARKENGSHPGPASSLYNAKCRIKHPMHHLSIQLHNWLA